MKKIKIDDQATKIERVFIIFDYGIRFLRYLVYSPFFGKAERIGFLARNVKIENKNKLYTGSYFNANTGVKISCYVHNKIEFGHNCTLKNSVIISGNGVLGDFGEELIVGDNVGISDNTIIYIRGAIKIGSNTIIGPNVKIISENHVYEDIKKPIRLQGTSRKGIEIGENVWIGAGVTILDGVKIGNDAIIAAGAIVNKNVDSQSIVAGIPAKLIKKRFDQRN